MKQDGDKESKSENATRKRVRHRKKLLYEKILKQMEFYFSDANLSKDRFLSQLVAESPFVPLETFLRFNNIRALTHDAGDIAKAMKHSALLELSAERAAVRRRVPLEPYDADARTVYVESLPAGASRDWLQRVFSEYGQVAYVSMPKFRDSQRIKGFAFVEFGSAEEAQKCLHVFTKMGCLLPTNLPPEELSSIKTFAEEPAPPEPPAPAPTVPDHKEPFEPPKKKSKKNKDKKNNKNCEPLENDPTAKQSAPEVQQEEKIPAAAQAGGAAGEAEGVGEGEARRARRRKRAAEPGAGAGAGAGAADEARGALWGLQVLSKRSWKALRNRYLNLQRTLGRGGRRRGAAGALGAPPAPVAAPPPPAAPAPAPAQPDGVFVRVTLAEPCRDVRETKRQLAGASGVPGASGAVHCEARAGRADALLRFRSADAARQYVDSVGAGAVGCGAGGEAVGVALARVLGGAECAAEWARAAAAQAARRARAAPPALPAPPQPSATHVRFDDE